MGGAALHTQSSGLSTQSLEHVSQRLALTAGNQLSLRDWQPASALLHQQAELALLGNLPLLPPNQLPPSFAGVNKVVAEAKISDFLKFTDVIRYHAVDRLKRL